MDKITLACLIFMFLPFFASGNTNICSCAAMDSPAVATSHLLLEHPLHVLANCEEEGRLMCQTLCRTLAEVTKDNPEGPQDFCKSVKIDVDHVNVSIFSKACQGDYSFTGLTFQEPICCRQGLNVDC